MGDNHPTQRVKQAVTAAEGAAQQQPAAAQAAPQQTTRQRRVCVCVCVCLLHTVVCVLAQCNVVLLKL